MVHVRLALAPRHPRPDRRARVGTARDGRPPPRGRAAGPAHPSARRPSGQLRLRWGALFLLAADGGRLGSSHVPGTPLEPFASVRAECQSGMGGLATVAFFILGAMCGSVVTVRGVNLRRAAWGWSEAERWGPTALCIPQSAVRAGSCGQWLRLLLGMRTPTVVLPGSSRRASQPELRPAWWVRGAHRGRPGLPGEGGRTLPSSGGSGASAARDRAGSAGAVAEADVRRSPGRGWGRHHGWKLWLPAGRWSEPWSWEPLVPALNLESLRPGGVQPRRGAAEVQAGKQVWEEWEPVQASLEQ